MAEGYTGLAGGQRPRSAKKRRAVTKVLLLASADRLSDGSGAQHNACQTWRQRRRRNHEALLGRRDAQHRQPRE